MHLTRFNYHKRRIGNSTIQLSNLSPISFIATLFTVCLFLSLLTTSNGMSQGEVLFKDDFRDPSTINHNYIIEGGKVSIGDGRLRIQANPAAGETYPKEAGIWINKIFDGDLSIEFEVNSLSAHRNATDLQLFLFFNAADGSPIERLFTPNKSLSMKVLKEQKGLIAIDFANTAERDGKVLTGTLINSPSCLLMYACPSGSLISKTFTSEYYVGKTYKIKVEYLDQSLLYYIDGILAVQCKDPDGDKRSGAIGFRTYLNDLTIENLVIRKLL